MRCFWHIRCGWEDWLQRQAATVSFGLLVLPVRLALVALYQASEDGCGARPLAEALPLLIVVPSQRTFLGAASGECAGRYASLVADGQEDTHVDAVAAEPLNQVSHGETWPCPVGVAGRRGQRRADHFVADLGPVDCGQACAGVVDPTVEPLVVDAAVFVKIRARSELPAMSAARRKR